MEGERRLGADHAFEAEPVRTKARIELWDVLRGFAVLGVLLANMQYMTLAAPAAGQETPFISHDPGLLDYFAFWFVRIFADTKFVTIFSILFGAGLGLMREKAVEAERPCVRIYLRRLTALLVFGYLHGVYIWFGDILFHYAIFGFIALTMSRLRPKTLFIIGLVLLFVWGLSWIVMLGYFDPSTEEAKADVQERIQRYPELFRSGDLLAMARERLKIFMFYLAVMVIIFGGRTLGLFLIGMALVKSRVMREPHEHEVVFRRFLIIGGIGGVLLTAVHVACGLYPDERGERIVQATTIYFMGLFLAPAYIACIHYWTRSETATAFRDRLRAVGQMAFTNYISHSVITGIIFNYLGQFDRWSRFEGFLLTFVIFAFQLWMSPIWLARFRFGPLEWLWRALTYWTLPPMRRIVKA